MSFAEIMWYTFLISSIVLISLCLIIIVIYLFIIKEKKAQKPNPDIVDENSKVE